MTTIGGVWAASLEGCFMSVIAAESTPPSTQTTTAARSDSDVLASDDLASDDLDALPIDAIQHDLVVFPPGDLYSDEPPLETSLHLQQLILLLQTLNWLWNDREDYFAAGNLTVYYSPNQRKDEHFRGPDFFVALNTEKRDRRSWTIWEENGQYPNMIVELLSESTADVDRGLKKTLYANIFRTPDYFWFDPHNLEFQGFHLVDGAYQALEPNEAGHLWSQQLGLFLGVQDQKLRFFTPEGVLVPTPEEFATAESQRANAAQEKNERLIAQLRSLGIEPD